MHNRRWGVGLTDGSVEGRSSVVGHQLVVGRRSSVGCRWGGLGSEDYPTYLPTYLPAYFTLPLLLLVFLLEH